jgi:V8-like Glu-specific endopeptidase
MEFMKKAFFYLLTKENFQRFIILSLLYFAILACTPEGHLPQQHTISNIKNKFQVIYSDDTIKELFEVKDLFTLKKSLSTVAFVESSHIFKKETSVNEYVIDGIPLKETMNLCSSERFAQQKQVSFCSGVLISPTQVLTVGHCVRKPQFCKSTLIAFDLQAANGLDLFDDSEGIQLKEHQLVHCKNVKLLTDKESKETGDSLALVELDHPIENRPFIEIPNKLNFKSVRDLQAIGHPLGLLKKVSTGHKLNRKNNSENVIYGSLDVYQGSSGSPIYSPELNTFVGLLVSGENDFLYDSEEKCWVSQKCDITSPKNKCRGEKIITSTLIQKWLKAKPASKPKNKTNLLDK